jgi:hypothetical protein
VTNTGSISDGPLVSSLTGLSTLYRRTDREQPKAKEDAMYPSVGVVVATVLVLASPIIWIAWWLLADLGARANGSHASVDRAITPELRRRAA